MAQRLVQTDILQTCQQDKVVVIIPGTVAVVAEVAEATLGAMADIGAAALLLTHLDTVTLLVKAEIMAPVSVL